MIQKPKISVFFPCYNDANTIGELIDNVHTVLKEISRDFEVIVINDGSSDNSAEVLREMEKKYKKTLRVITHVKNKGYGGALKSGFKTASKELIFYTDSDGQYDVGELPLLLNLMTVDVDFVNGIKMQRQDSEERIFFGNLHKFITRWLFWLPIYDTDCDFRLIRKKIIDKIRLTSNSGSICPELVKKSQRAGATFREVSVHHYERRWGSSQFFKPSKIIKTYSDLALLWFDLMILHR